MNSMPVIFYLPRSCENRMLVHEKSVDNPVEKPVNKEEPVEK